MLVNLNYIFSNLLVMRKVFRMGLGDGMVRDRTGENAESSVDLEIVQHGWMVIYTFQLFPGICFKFGCAIKLFGWV